MFSYKSHLLRLSKITSSLHRKYTARRALMYVPGNDMRKLQKAFSLDVDCIVMDCEDGVAFNKKTDARETIHKIYDQKENNINTLHKKTIEWSVRVNSVDSGLCEEDLSAVLSAQNKPSTILLPKVENVKHLDWFSDKVKHHLKNEKQINLIMYAESAISFLELPNICEKAVNLSKTTPIKPAALVFGSDDFCASIGATRTQNSLEILYARQKLVLIAKAYNLQAIDMVYIQYKDLEGLKHQSEEGARMGYTGKQVIHPGQVPIVQEAFKPSQESVSWATGLLHAFDTHQKSGKGAFVHNGSMIDMPTMKQAQNIINLITAINTKPK